MPHASDSTFLSSDSHTVLHSREYLPDGEVKGVVQLVHGIAEHLERYDDFARFLAGNGFIVVIHDQLGHGKSAPSPEELGFFGESGGWEKAVQDIHTLHEAASARHPGRPYFLLGHSMGSFLARTYIIRFRTGLDGVVLSGTGQLNSPVISAGLLLSRAEVRRHGARYRSPLLYKAAFGGYTDKLGPVRTSCDWLSRDEEVVDRYLADPLCGFVPTAGLIRDMMGGLDFIGRQKNIQRMKRDLPVLFFSGDCDPVGEQGRGVIRTYKRFLRAGMTDVTMKLYHGGRHEMLNETNRQEVYLDVLCWLNGKAGH